VICDKCGKSNISGLSECSYCGAEMPKTSACGGFADILSYKSSGETTPPTITPDVPRYEKEKKSEGISDLDMQKLIKKSDSIMKSTKVNSLFGLIAIGLSFLILVSSIIFGIVTISTVKGYKEETMTQLEETKKELTDYKTQLDTLFEKIEDDKTDNTNNIENKDDNKNEEKDEPEQETTNNETKDKTKTPDKENEKDDKVKNPSLPTTDADGNIKNQ